MSRTRLASTQTAPLLQLLWALWTDICPGLGHRFSCRATALSSSWCATAAFAYGRKGRSQKAIHENCMQLADLLAVLQQVCSRCFLNTLLYDASTEPEGCAEASPQVVPQSKWYKAQAHHHVQVGFCIPLTHHRMGCGTLQSALKDIHRSMR